MKTSLFIGAEIDVIPPKFKRGLKPIHMVNSFPTLVLICGASSPSSLKLLTSYRPFVNANFLSHFILAVELFWRRKNSSKGVKHTPFHKKYCDRFNGIRFDLLFDNQFSKLPPLSNIAQLALKTAKPKF